MIGSNLNQAARALNEIALDDGKGRWRKWRISPSRSLRVLDALRLTLAENRRALGHDREG